MIIQPDFLDHWKTRELIERTDNPAAPLAVIRLWAHCQSRMAWEFEGMDAARLAAVCHWTGDSKQFHLAMRKAGFIDVIGRKTVVHDWAVVNASLIAAWTNGRKSRGRPITHGIPTGNPRITQSNVEQIEQIEQTEQIEQREKTEQIEQSGGDGRDAPGTEAAPPSGEAEKILSSYSVLESVRFLCGGSKTKAATKTLEDLTQSVPETKARKICATVYALKLKGGLKKEPAAMLTSMMMKASIEGPER